MPCIKVGLSEWILLNSMKEYPMVLWTDGIISCVGVAVTSKNRAFMTHIYSGISVDQWENKIKAEFKEAIGRFGSFDAAYCCIAVNRDPEDPKTDLEEAVEKTLIEVGLGPHSAQLAGMRVWNSPTAKYKPGFNFDPLFENGFGPEKGFSPEWGKVMNSVTGAEYIEAHGFFSSEEAGAGDITPYASSEDIS
jgi:hypothetical protein